MPKLSINELHKLTGIQRDTIVRRIGDLKFERTGTHDAAAKLYDAKDALPLIYGYMENNEGVTMQVAARDLSVAKKQQIELNMESVRRERIPLEEIGEINAECFDSIAGLIRSCENKQMTAERIQDIFAELRKVADFLIKYQAAIPTEENETVDMNDPIFN